MKARDSFSWPGSPPSEEVAGDARFAADRIIRKGIETHNACISFQVVQECLYTLLRKAEIRLSADETISGQRPGTLVPGACQPFTLLPSLRPHWP